MYERVETSVGVGTQTDLLDGLRSMANSAEHLLPCEVQLHRAPDFLSGNRAQHGMRPDEPLAAEPSAYEGRDDMNSFLRHTQDFGNGIACADHPLGGFVECQIVAGPFRNGSGRLHWIVVLGRCRVSGFVLDGRRLICGLRIATLVRQFVAEEFPRIVKRVRRLFDFDDRSLDRIVDLDQRSRELRLLQGFGDY